MEMMDKISVEERRSIRRFALQLPLTVQLPVTMIGKPGGKLQATAESLDVSSHGICFLCEASIEPRTEIAFTLTLPSEITMTEPMQVHCTGSVVRVQRHSASGKFAVAAAIDHYDFVATRQPSGVAAGADAQPVV